MRRINWGKVRLRLLTELRFPTTDPRSPRMIACELELPVRLIRTHEPEIMHQLAQRYRRAIAHRARARRVAYRESVIAACLRLFRRNVPLTLGRVEAELGNPGILWRSEARCIIRHELGKIGSQAFHACCSMRHT